MNTLSHTLGKENQEKGEKTFTWSKQSYFGVHPRRFHTCTLINKYLVIYGGLNPDALDPQYIEETVIINLENNSTHVVVGPPGRYGHTACYHPKYEKIIVFGGTGPQSLRREGGGGLFGGGIQVSRPLPVLTMRVIENSQGELSLDWHDLLSPSLFARTHHTAHIYKDDMIIFGGFGESDQAMGSSDIYLFKTYDNLASYDLLRCSSNPYHIQIPPRLGHFSFLHNNKLFVYGGSSNFEYFNDFWRLDIDIMKWELISEVGPNQPSPRAFAAIEKVNEKVYVFGGETGSGDSNELWTYEIETNTWDNLSIQTKGEAPGPANFSTCVYYNQNLIIYGGSMDRSVYFLSLSSDATKVAEDSGDHFINHMKKLFQEKKYSDVTFQIKDQEITAHKNILASRCKHFEDMFKNSGMTDPQSTKIEIKDAIQFQSFQALMKFIYCNEIEVDQDLARDLLRVAHLYSFPELKDACSQYLGRILTLENYTELSDASEEYEAPVLKTAVLDFISKNISHIKKQEEHGDISHEMLWNLIFKIGRK